MRGCPEALGHNSTGNSSLSSNVSDVSVSASISDTLASDTMSTSTASTSMAPSNVSTTGQPNSGVNNDTAENLSVFTRDFLIYSSLSLIIVTEVTILVYLLVDTLAQVRPSLTSAKTPISVDDE
ncbi:hypothetical protein SprV_0200641800 [Sparganum proliferum]